MTKNIIRLTFLIVVLIGLIISISTPTENKYKISAKSEKSTQTNALKAIYDAQGNYIYYTKVLKSWSDDIIFDGNFNTLDSRDNVIEKINSFIENEFIFDECQRPIFEITPISRESYPRKPFITPNGNQTKLINDVLFNGKKTLDEDGYYFYFIAHNYLSPVGQGSLICAESKIESVRYCVNNPSLSDEYQSTFSDYLDEDDISTINFGEGTIQTFFGAYHWMTQITDFIVSVFEPSNFKFFVYFISIVFVAFSIDKAPYIFRKYIHKDNNSNKKPLLKTTYTLIALIVLSVSLSFYASTLRTKTMNIQNDFYAVEFDIDIIQCAIHGVNRSLDGRFSTDCYQDFEFLDHHEYETRTVENLDRIIKNLIKSIVDIKPYIEDIDTKTLDSAISTFISGNELSDSQAVKLNALLERAKSNSYDPGRWIGWRFFRTIYELTIVISSYMLILVLYTRYSFSKRPKIVHTIFFRWTLIFILATLFTSMIWGVIQTGERILDFREDIEKNLKRDLSFSDDVLLLANNPTFENKKELIRTLSLVPHGGLWGVRDHEFKNFLSEIVTDNRITKSKLERLKKLIIRKKADIKYEIGLLNKLGTQFQSIFFYFVVFIFLLISILTIIFELLTPYRDWLGISLEKKNKINQHFRWGGIFLVITAISLLSLIILIRLNPNDYQVFAEFLSPLVDMIATFDTYYQTTERHSALQLLLIIPVVFALIAIMVILYAKKELTSYVIKLAQGEKVDPPKIRLQEFSQIAESIDSLQKRLKGKKYIETFISSIAHEVRAPLAGIRANTESLNLTMDDVDFTQSKNNIIESNDRMLLIIDSLLELAKLEQQNKSLEKTKFDINNTIGDIINNPDVAKKAKDKNTNLSFKTYTGSIILGNEILIEMCLLNVINNAIDFSLKSRNIYINVTEDKKSISIEILDEGVGISDNMLDKIQNKFVSTSRPYTKKRSTGLGLNLVKIIMELHNGNFEINNRQDTKGVVVVLTFPK